MIRRIAFSSNLVAVVIAPAALKLSAGRTLLLTRLTQPHQPLSRRVGAREAASLAHALAAEKALAPGSRRVYYSRMRIWVGVGIAMAAACGNDNNPPPDAGPEEPEPTLLDSHAPVKSGTRLKLQWHDIGGQRSFVSTFDTERNTVCSALTFPDGNLYCAPPRTRTDAFKDANCTMPLARVSRSTTPCAPPPSHLYWTTPSATCGGAPTVHGLYRAIATTVSTHYILTSDGICTRSVGGSLYDFYEAGEEVSPAGLVKMASATEEVGSGRLRFTYRSADDGAKVFVATRDSQFDGSCLFVPTDSGQGSQCLANFVEQYFYADGSCTAPAAGVRNGCTPPKHIATLKSKCSLSVAMYVRGPESTAPQLYEYDSFDQVCRAAEKQPGYTYYEAGAEVSIAILQRPASRSSARVEAIQYVDGEVRQRSPLGSPRFYDRELKTDCDVITLADGSRRCFPSNLNFSTAYSYYSDAACQSPLSLVTRYQERCEDVAAPLAVGESTFRSCPPDYRAYRVGERYTGALYRSNGKSCALETAKVEAYLRGDQIPLDQLPAAELVTDP